MLGLSGTVDDDAFLALMAGMDPRDPERLLGNGYSEKWDCQELCVSGVI
jgi:hypothetical protein